MEIKMSEIYEKFNNQTEILGELDKLITGKQIELYELDENGNYEFLDNYNVISTYMWEDDQIVFSFGPSEYDVVSVMNTDLIKIKD